MSQETTSPKFTLCWDCARATGKCPWSDRLVPVKGWVAEKTKPSNSKPYVSYIVRECPGFVRDALRAGLKRYNSCKDRAV